ncbi:MAG: hypothetical protein HY770_05250 [Chitinivibrionia bacterium]|nr:hypothetical protein [Chitinivibrionia bacterium]
MLIYRHTQVGKLVLALVGIPIVVLILVALFVEAEAMALVTLGLLAVALVLFSTLTVEVGRDSVLIWFGPGIVRKRFALSDIRGVRVVRNKWFYGWGIRRLPSGWLYCVSGLDAVELEMTDGTRQRIGTDCPKDLEAAIQKALGLLAG